MKIYNKIVLEWNSITKGYDTVLYEDSYDYSGPLMLAGPNDPPGNVAAATGVGSGKIDVTWNKSPSENGNSYWEDYEIRYDTDSAMKSSTTVTGPKANGSANYGQTLTLTAATTYYIQVRLGSNPNTGEGASNWEPSSPVQVTSGTGVPVAPTLAAATDVKYSTITLSWNAVSTATEYRLVMDEGTGDPTTQMQAFDQQSWGTPPATSYVFGNEQGEDLDEGQIYSFRLKAYNSNGTSGFSNKLTQSTLWEDAGDLSTSNNTAYANTISWDVPVSDAGGDESKLYGDTSNPPTTLISTQSGTGNKDYDHTGLNDSTTYYYRVRIYLNNNNGWYTTHQVSSVTNPAGVPADPGAPSVSAKTDTTINTSWSAVSGATGYKLYYGTSSNPTGPGTTQSGTTKNFSSLSSATTYYFRLKAFNSNGDSGYGSALTVDTTTTAGGQPSSPTSVTPVSQTVSWTNPSGTVTAFLYGGTSANPTTLLTSGAGLATYNHSALTPGTTYYYRTRTQTTNHNNLFSQYSSDRSGATATVDRPTSIGYTATSTSTITFNWTNPTFTGRTYFYYPNPQYPVTSPDYVTGTTRLIGDGDRIQGNLISIGANSGYSLQARNYFSPSTAEHYSTYTATFTGYTLPGPPTSLSATPDSDEEITVTWTGPSGAALTETFFVEWGEDTNYSTGNYTTSANATSYQITGLNGSTNYDIRVTTKTDAGDDPTMATTDATTLSGPNPTNEELEMKYLGVMTGDASEGAEISMQTANGGATTEISLRDFFAGGLDYISGPGTVTTDSITTFTAVFSNSGDAFNAQVATGKFAWTISGPPTYAVIDDTNGRTCDVEATGPNMSGFTLYCTFTKSFNDHMSVVSKNKTVNIQSG